jgi:hypothetical protein
LHRIGDCSSSETLDVQDIAHPIPRVFETPKG